MIRRQFPNVLLEGKEVAIEGGVDTVPQQQVPNVDKDREAPPESRNNDHEDMRNQTSIAATKLKRNVRPPEKLGDFVAK